MKLKKEIIESSEFEKLIKGTTWKELLLEIINADRIYEAFYSIEIFKQEINIALHELVDSGIIDERMVK